MKFWLNYLWSMFEGLLKPLLAWFGTAEGDDVEKIRDRVTAMCGFLPTAASVAAMLAASNPTVTGVIGIASAICQAVSPKPGLTLIGNKTPTVNGVPVEGEFIIKA